MNIQSNPSILIHWRRFGPYHIARLEAAAQKFRQHGVRVIGLEISSQDETYQWRVENSKPKGFTRHTLFPGAVYENLTTRTIQQRLFSRLGQISPSVVAITGYAPRDSLLLLTWCRLYRHPTILMTDSKVDDTPRYWWRERLKSILIHQFAAAICGGSSHKNYLRKLGMPADCIWTGYDVVDNKYFSERTQRVRQNHGAFRHLPGLNESSPFFLASSRFIPRKNLLGLLQAYTLYRKRCLSNNTQPWRLVILGEGPERPLLENFVKQQSLEGVCLPGFQQIDVLPAYYGLAKLFIHPALQEQWGLVVNEAMAAGLPVLVSERCGCVPELVRNGENGFTFDPQDVKQLSDLLYQCSTGKHNLALMGQMSRKIIGGWGPERFASNLYKAFLRVFACHG